MKHECYPLNCDVRWIVTAEFNKDKVTMRGVRKTIVAVEVLVALGIQHKRRMYHIFICGLFGSTIYFHLIS